MPSYQKTIDLHKAQVQEVIENLAGKGIDVSQIEYQTKMTEDKIAELNEKLEELPGIKRDLIVHYKIEKEERLILNQHVNNLNERSEENLRLFSNKDWQATSGDSIKSDNVNEYNTWNLQYEEGNNSMHRKR